MKKRKLLIAALCATSALTCAFGFAACDNNTDDGSKTHEHTYATEWTNDATNHWHAASCEHKDEKKDEAAHDTTGTDGACSVCGYKPQTTTPGDETEDLKITVGTDKTIKSLTTEGLSLTLDGTELGTKYTLSSTNDKVLFVAGIKQGNPVTFECSVATKSVTVKSINGTLENVILKLAVAEESSDEYEKITLGQVVTVSGLDPNDFSACAVYSIDLEAGFYNIYANGEKSTGLYDEFLADGPTLDAEQIPDDGNGNIEVTAAGTYYLFGFIDGATLKVQKFESATTVTVGTPVEVVVGAEGYTLSIDGCEDGTVYAVTAKSADGELADVSLSIGTSYGNPATFTYSGMLSKAVNVSANNYEKPVIVTVSLEEYEEENNDNEITVGQEVTVTGADFLTPVKYLIELEAGYYDIYVDGEKLTTDDMDVVLEYGEGNDAMAIYMTKGKTVIEETGTYYLSIYRDLTIKIEATEGGSTGEDEFVPDTPNEDGSYTITASANADGSGKVNIASIDEEGVTIKLEGCVEGGSYSIYWMDEKTFVNNEDIVIEMTGEDEPSYTLMFVFDGTNNSVVVKSLSGTLSNATITLYTNALPEAE